MNGQSHTLYGALSSCCLAWRFEAQTADRLQAAADFVFPDAYAGFHGHFPDQPILPGIVQLAAVRYLAECAVSQKLSPRRYDKIKFKGMIGPGERVTVAVTLSAGAAGWSGTFSLTRHDGATASTGRVEYLSEGI